MNSKRFGNLLLTGVILIMLGCSGKAVSEQEAKASPASVNMTLMGDEMNWVGIRRIENKTKVEVDFYDNKGDVGKIVSQLLERAKIDIKDYPVSFITRAQNSMLYTGGSKAHDGLDTTFFLILRPLDKTVSLCKLDQAKADYISNNGAPDTVEMLPPDVLLSIDNIIQGQQLVIEGERYMREYNIDPYAPITVSAPTVMAEELNPSLEEENYPHLHPNKEKTASEVFCHLS